jgi:phosphate:Na+ symporter
MSTTIAILGGVGLFLLGMSVMTSSLKALAGPGLRTTLGKVAATPVPRGSEDVRAAGLCAEAMRHAVLIAGAVGALPGTLHEAAAQGAPTGQALAQLEHCATTLRDLQWVHRQETLSSVAGTAVTADEAIARVEFVRRLEAIARYAWRSAVYLVDSTATAVNP